MPKGSTNPIRNISAETCNLISDMSPEATSDEVSFGCIRDIRGVFQKFPNFPRKGSKNFTQYITEQPEMRSQLRGLEEGQNNENQIKPKEKR